jgi:hypothetical protein
MVFLLYSIYPLSFCDKKGEYFLCFWTGNVFPNRSSVFLSQNGKRGSLLVFYVSNILVDKNTLCKSCILNRFIGFIQNLQVIWTVFVSSHVTGNMFQEDVHEDSMQFPSQINRFLCSRLDGPLKESEHPIVF